MFVYRHQVSQYTFAMCSYRERKADPTEILQLDGFTVDFCEPIEGRVKVLCFYIVIDINLCLAYNFRCNRIGKL